MNIAKHLFALFLICLSGVALSQDKEGPVRITFLDSRLFDGSLSKELDSGRDTVEVEISGKVSLSNIPGRIDKWISAVGEAGEVKVKPSEPQSRSFFGVISTVFSFLKELNEERMLSKAHNYNATIYYRKDAGGDTLIEKIVFIRKPQGK